MLMLQRYLLAPTVLRRHPASRHGATAPVAAADRAGDLPVLRRPPDARLDVMRTEYVEAVLAVVELVPAGTAVAYGDVAELLGSGGARQVGSVMSHHGSSVPWWRVLKASGDAPPGHEARGPAALHPGRNAAAGQLRRTTSGPAKDAGAWT